MDGGGSWVGIMGLLTKGVPCSPEETAAMADHVRRHGVQQFIRLYKKLQAGPSFFFVRSHLRPSQSGRGYGNAKNSSQVFVAATRMG